jgi:hypothetical protein
MLSSGMRRHVVLVRIYVSEERFVSIIRDGGDTFLRNVGIHKSYKVSSQMTEFFTVTLPKAL